VSEICKQERKAARIIQQSKTNTYRNQTYMKIISNHYKNKRHMHAKLLWKHQKYIEKKKEKLESKL
jgi:hypothetical protein